MRAATAEFRRTMAERRNFVNYADMTLSTGEVLHLVPKDFRLSGNSIEDDIVDGDNFSVGTALGKTVTIVLDNTDERFSLYDFYGAYFFLYVALPLPTEQEPYRVEKIRIGKFTVITPATTGTLITIEGVDNMFMFDQLYENSHQTYPATLGEIVDEACARCGVVNNTGHFSQYNFYVEEKPKGDFTFRQIISYVCQIACCYAKIDDLGALRFGWFEDITPESSADGGNYSRAGESGTPYITGDNLDGGTFAYNDGDNYDGGRFTDAMSLHNLGGSAKGVKVGTDDIVITGVEVKNGKDVDKHVVTSEFNSSNAYEIGDVVSVWSGDTYRLYKFIEPHTAGASWNTDEVAETLDYDIIVSDNPLASGKEEEIAQILGTKLIGLRFRPFSLSYLQDPTIESGDWVIVEDIKRNAYKSFITNVKFSTLGYMSISCNAQPPSKVASTYSSSAASAIVKQNRLTIEQISYYDVAVQRMNALAANAMGMYTYEKVDNTTGSRIFYLSNKPISDHDGEPNFVLHSKLWKLTGDGFFLCQDAGITDRECAWTNGWDNDGNVVVNSLSAIGISFDWARGGTLTLGGDNNINGVLSVLNAMGRERVRLDNTGMYSGDQTGSKLWINTEGELQYFFDNQYAGKMRMSTDSSLTLDYLSFEDFANIRVGDWHTDSSWMIAGQNNASHNINAKISANSTSEDITSYISNVDKYGNVHISADGYDTESHNSSIDICGDGHTYFKGKLCPDITEFKDNKPIEAIDKYVEVVDRNNQIITYRYINGMLVDFTQNGIKPGRITYGTQDLTPGTDPLTTGDVYLVYEE